MTPEDQAELDRARDDVERLLYAASVSPEAEIRRLASLARAQHALERLERELGVKE